MATKKKAKRSGKGCGCSTKGAKLYIVKTPKGLRATKCKGKAQKLVKSCRKRNKAKGPTACTWMTTSGVRHRGGGKRRRRK